MRSAADAEIKQNQALELERNQERDRADALAREVTSLRAELETARAVGLETARSTAPHAVALPLADEQKLLARATTLVGQADIGGARPLVQHALELGSARTV